MVAQTRTTGQSSPQRLKFRDKLVGKNLTTDALQKKLKALNAELSDLDQEHVETSSLNAVRKELISAPILLHKDRGVKAYTACCLADLLRLYAPDAPYTQEELRDIFQFFFRQLSQGLKGPDSPYYNEYFHLLESLSTVKSVVLVCDLPNADELMADIFRGFFAMVRLDLAKKIELFMADILIALLDECQTLPPEVLETIMAQFMDKNPRLDQPAYRLAVQVCSATADKLQRYVCQYFTDIIVSNSEEENYEEMQTAHTLIKRLNRAVPALLHNVVPQLEEELRVQDVQIRVMATQTLSEMFADVKSGAEFVKKYPTTWNSWLARKNDQGLPVRLAFVEGAKGVLVNMTPPEPREELEEALQSKLLDPDEKVRSAVCRLYGQIDYETALHHVSDNQLKSIAGRGVDKRPAVQNEAMKAIARLYHLAYPEIENNNEAAIHHFAWIPQAILQMSTASTEVKALAEQMLTEWILPLPAASSSSGKTAEVDEVVWTERLLCTMKHLDRAAINSLRSLSGIKAYRPTIYERFIEACIKNNGGVIDDDEEAVIADLSICIKRISTQYHDPQKASDDLNAFARLNEGRLYKLFKTCMDPQTDLKGLVKSTTEFMKRLEQSSSTITSTLTVLLRRASLRIINQSSIPTLIKRVAKHLENVEASENSQAWLIYVSKHYPALYKQHIGELTKAIADEKNPTLVEVALQALAFVAQWNSALIPNDRRLLERLKKYALESNYRHAKFAARVLAYTNKEEVCDDIVESIADALPKVGGDKLAAHVMVLAQLALRASSSFERKSDVIVAFLLKHVIMAHTPVDEDAMKTDEEWIEDACMSPELRAKVLALKVCRNRCIALASSEEAYDIAQPVLRMFVTLLQYNGAFAEHNEVDPPTKTRLRLQAALSMLHLACFKQFQQYISPHFVFLAIQIQDPCYQVRMAFVTKLAALLTARKLSPMYHVILFLAVHDPEPDVINTAQAFVKWALLFMPTKLKLENFEMTFIRLLHLLAHHPDFAVTEEAIEDISKYIMFYLDLVLGPDNVSLLYHLAMKAKTVRDAESHTYSENLYAMSEIAQRLIRARAKAHSWSLETYPGKVKLPGDILRPLPNAEAATKIVQTVFLPDSLMAWLDEKQPKQTVEKERKKKEKPERKAPTKRKANATKNNGHAKRPRRVGRPRKYDSGEETSDEPSEEDDDDEEDEENQEAGPAQSPTMSASEDEKEDEKREETRPGRSARTRANARIKQQAKKPNKGKARAVESD